MPAAKSQLARRPYARCKAGEILRAKDRAAASARTGNKNDARPAIQREWSAAKAPPVTRQWRWRCWGEGFWPHVCRIAVMPSVPPQVSRIAPEGEQRVRRRPKQQRIDHPGIALRERVEVVRQGEDHVKVRNRQEIPPSARRAIAPW